MPPTRTAKVSRRGPRSRARDRTIADVETLGRREWQKASGCHRQARVENAFFRCKSIIGDGLRARSTGGRDVETSLPCRVLRTLVDHLAAFGRDAPGRRLDRPKTVALKGGRDGVVTERNPTFAWCGARSWIGVGVVNDLPFVLVFQQGGTDLRDIHVKIWASIVMLAGVTATGALTHGDVAVPGVAPGGVVREAPVMLAPRAAHSATTLVDGRILVAGGFTQQGSAPGAEVYEMDASRSSAAGPMLELRHSHTATRLPTGQVLLIGGYGEGGRTLASTELVRSTHEPLHPDWTARLGASQPHRRAAHHRASTRSRRIGRGLDLSVDCRTL